MLRGADGTRHAGVTECGEDGGMTPIRRLLILPALIIVLTACSSAGSGPTDPQPSADAGMATAPASQAEHPAMSDGAAMSPTADPAATTAATGGPSTPEVPVLDQAWATATLTDVATGESFRIADLAGQPMIIETMAIWCPSCLSQQAMIHDALDELGPDRVEYVVIDIDPSETAPALAQYKEKHEFEGRYVVADRDVARALAAEFGDQILNAPSTPVVFIGTDGRVTLTPFGRKSTDDIVALAREHGA